MDELRQHFGSLCSESIIIKLLSEADKDKDGKISFPEFAQMMEQYRDVNLLYKKNGATK